MRFARHLAAVVLVVAVIVVMAVAWEHSSASGLLGTGPGHPGRHAAPVSAAAPAGTNSLTRSADRLRGIAAFNLSDLMDLVRTVVIEAVLIAVVVAIDGTRRRRRRARRSAIQPLAQ
jgi:hypothetical protein